MAGLIFVSIIYLSFGAIRAIQTLNICEFNIHEIEVDKKDTEYVLKSLPDDEELLKKMVKGKKLNDLINIRLSNLIYASFNLIRNGIIIFVLFFISTIIISYFSHRKKNEDKKTISKELTIKVNDTVNVQIPYSFDFDYNIDNLLIVKPKNEQ